MPNNYRITGNYYVSKAGIDTANGQSMETPKATVTSALGVIPSSGSPILVLGCGQYDESINKAGGLNTTTTIIADGEVKLRGSSLVLIGTAYTWSNTTFENYTSSTLNAGTFNGCTFINCTVTTSNNCTFNNCKFINCNFSNAGLMTYAFCIFINSSPYINSALNCYFNSSSVYRIKTQTAANHNYNNVMGSVLFGSTTYNTLEEFKTAQPTYHVNSFNLSPKFNNVSKLDFTLQFDSPHIGAASDGVNNIGGTVYAKTTVATGPEWTEAGGALFSKSDGVNPDIILVGNDLILAPGKNYGQVTSAPIKLNANPVPIDLVFYNGELYYNKSQAGGGVSNNNVPDASVYGNTSGASGASPDRLSWELRYTDNDTMPGSDVDYTNGFNTAPGVFIAVELNKQPRVDGAGLGNALPNYSTSTNYAISAVWVQPRITLTNQYL